MTRSAQCAARHCPRTPAARFARKAFATGRVNHSFPASCKAARRVALPGAVSGAQRIYYNVSDGGFTLLFVAERGQP